jgi:hypothetical protein
MKGNRHVNSTSSRTIDTGLVNRYLWWLVHYGFGLFGDGVGWCHWHLSVLLPKGRYEMIAAIAALLFYMVDARLGIIVAILAPGIVGLDTDESYSDLMVFLLFAVGAVFVRKFSTEKED